MPLDPRIPLGVQPAPIQNPLETLQTVAQVQGIREQTEARRLAADEARQKAMDQAAIRRVLTETGGDIEKALPQLRVLVPKAALEFETEIATQRKTAVEALRAQTEYQGKQLDVGTRLLQGVTDDASFQIVRPLIATMSPQIGQAMGETYDPAKVKQFLDVGLTAKEVNDRRNEGLKLLTEGKAVEGVGTWLSTVKTPEEWTGVLDGAATVGVPREILNLFGDFSPENVTRAAQLAITPAKRAELAGQAETRAGQAAGREQTAAHQGVLEAQGAERIGIARQRASQAATAQAGAGGTLPPRQETTVRGLAGAFRNEAAVKRTTTMAEAVNFVSGLASDTKNPADDQGLIYAFAKAMDPESVVREGEYATVQKYATSWLERFGFDARRVLTSETPILTAKARENLKATINGRYQASRGQYDNLVKSYTAQINKATGRDDGAERLTDYAGAFPLPAGAEDTRGAGGGLNTAGLTYQDYLRSKGK